MLFAVADSGIVRMRKQANGNMAVTSIGTAHLVKLLAGICTPERSERRHTSHGWLVHASSVETVIAELSRIAIRIPAAAREKTTAI